MQEIIKQIDELTEATNKKLCEIRNKLGKMAGKDKKAEMTAKEAWDLAAGISLARPTTLMEIFDMSDPAKIFVYNDPEATKCLWDAYFHKNKETEEETIKPGDRVDIYSSLVNKLFENYIFIGECEGEYLAVRENDTGVSWFCKESSKISKRKE